MTRDEFIEAALHELRGHVMEAVLYDRKGAVLSLWLKGVTGKLTTRLGELYDELIPPNRPEPIAPVSPRPSQNGAAVPRGVRQ